MALGCQHWQNPADPLWPILMRIRCNEATDEDMLVLNTSWPSGTQGGGAAIDEHPEFQHLRAVNGDVDAYNARRVARLPHEPVTFAAVDTIHVKHPRRVEYAQQIMHKLARCSLLLKVEAQVVLTRTDGDVKSGTRGVAQNISRDGSALCVLDGGRRTMSVRALSFDLQDATEEVLATQNQLPLMLSWALTVTRAQGMTLCRCVGV